MDKTLFFIRDLLIGHGGSHYPGSIYDEHWWTYPGADDPLAPDDEPDPYGAERGDANLRRPRHFMMTKNTPDKLTAAKRKRNLLNVLGTDWTMDPEEALAGNSPTFEGVTYTAKFTLWRDRLNEIGRRSLTGRRSWERQFSEIKNKLSGKTWLISPQEDRWFFREGRVEVADTSKGERGELTITADCDPWKYEKYSSMDEWEWDDLDFECSVIRERDDYMTTGLAYGDTFTVSVVPLEKAEPVWVDITPETGITSDVKIWLGNTEPENSETMADAWRETELVPTEESHTLHIKNVTAGMADIDIKVYYRGAMR